MKTTRIPAWFTIAIVLIAVTSIFLRPLPAAAQDALFYDAVSLPPPPGAVASSARGLSERGWEPLTVVGTVENTTSNASCWIRTQQQWAVHVLPGLHPGAASWANAVDHVRVDVGEWTMVAGAAVCSTGTPHPVYWDNITNGPWGVHPLPTLSGGHGEARGLFLPDGTPVRALVCGWADETPPVGGANLCTIGLRVVEVWEVTPTGERIMQPNFGVGLESYANDIASSGPGVFFTFGTGQNSAGVWKPQVWKSVDDGETWSNEELPLPLGVESGEVTECDHEVGHWLGAGYGVTTSGRHVPLLWDMDTSLPVPTWIIHELPLPALDEGGQNGIVLKLPGRTKYANIVLKRGLDPVVGIWVDDPGGGWTLHEPEDYLLNPEVGTPIEPAGFDKYGRVAVKFRLPPTATTDSPVQAGEVAGILIPNPATGVEDGKSAPRLIALSVSPNPFTSGIRIGYTLPRDAMATVTVHDVTGSMVAILDQGQLVARQQRVVHWNGIARVGGRVASGIYFVRVETPYEISTVKIVRID